MEKYNSDEGVEIKSLMQLFANDIQDSFMLGEEPFKYEKLEDAKLVVDALNLIFKGKLSIQSFIIVKEIN
tara:strand:- start:288 stop:497 length:210 start_codon:yes stop_codon:yes gene_type:complete